MSNVNKLSLEIGKRIYDRRKQLGLTQETLSELTDTTPQAISNYERGERELKATTIIKMAKALNVTSDYLLTGNDYSIKDLISDIEPEKQNLIIDIINKCIKLSD